MRRFFLFILLIINSLQFASKPPELTPTETHRKANEILKAHVRYKNFDETVAQKTFIKYLEELDPTKTYFTEEEVLTWTSPSDETIQLTVNDFHAGQFTQYEKIFGIFQKAIERRNEIEKEIKGKELPQNIDRQEFKKLEWVKNRSELIDRVEKIRAMQLEAAAKIDDETKDRFLKRIQKRRLSREQEFFAEEQGIEKRQMLSCFLKAVAGALDAHTAYFTPSEADQFLLLVQQRLEGIGAQLRDDLNGFTLTRLLEGGPALRGGILKVGDRIIAVNNEPVVGLDITEAVELIKGPKGTKVTLTCLREKEQESGEKLEEKFTVDVIRDELVLQESRFEYDTIDCGDGVILHLKLYSFYQDEKASSSGDIQKAFREVSRVSPVKGVVLDVRNNAGGLLTQAVTVSGLFIKKGIVCSVKDNSGNVQHLRNFDEDNIWDGPLLVLTNVWSASASEIVAQTLQDYGRAFVIGDERTFGKGTYQTFTLGSLNSNKINPRGEYKVTRGLYYTVSGKSPQFIGAKADIVTPGEFSKLEIGEQFAKFPLPNESIDPNFLDTLADVHPFHRARMHRSYAKNLQQKIVEFSPYLTTLQSNSEKRIAQNENYQRLLRVIQEETYDVDKIEDFGKNDLQLEETINVMKDFITLHKSRLNQ